MTTAVMNNLNTYSPTARPAGGSKMRPVNFRDMIKPNDFATDRTTESKDDVVRKQAQSLVAINFIQPILTQAHDTAFKSDLFHGGAGEEMFQQQLDTILADRIAQKSNLPIVDAVYQQVMKRTASTTGKVNLHG